MKLALKVSSGVHAGKLIPVTHPQFVIGRDPECQLRPASSAISKRHCAIIVRGSKVFIRDFGSTNGTFVAGEPVEGEVEITHGTALKVGPLEFTLEVTGQPATAKPAEAVKPEAAATKPEPVAKPSESEAEEALADQLLNEIEDVPRESTLDPDAPVPEGSTVMDLPAVKPEQANPQYYRPPAKAPPTSANTSSAAAEILRRYQRRPRT